MYFGIWIITVYQLWLLFLSLTWYSYFSLNPRSFTSVGVWYQEFSSMIRSVYWMRNSPELQMEKRMLMEISQLCILQPLFIFLQHTAALWHCPTGKMTTTSVHLTQFFNTFFFHAVRNAFWEWSEDEGRKKVLTALLCGSSSVSLSKSYGWEPTPLTNSGSHRAYLQHFISSFYESIVNKREKPEFGWE